jgi:hypothetical protein
MVEWCAAFAAMNALELACRGWTGGARRATLLDLAARA